MSLTGNLRFGFQEDLIEAFSPSCTTVCAQTNLPAALAAACDTGSQAYCANSANIASANCAPYLDRVIKTRQSSITSAPYSNPIKFPTGSTSTIATYYNALGDAADQYIKSNIANLSTANVTSLMNVINAETGTDRQMATKIANNVITACNTSTDASCGSSISWVVAQVAANMQAQATSWANTDLTTILSSMTSNAAYYTKYATSATPVFNLVLSKVKMTDLTNPNLLSLRLSQPAILTGIDLFVINYIVGATPPLTTIPLDSKGAYKVETITSNKRLYDATVRAFYNAIRVSANASSDKMVALIAAADSANIARCGSIDATTDPVCTAMTATNEAALISGIKNATSAFCITSANVAKPQCVAYVNSITSQAGTNPSTVYPTVLSAAANTDGTLNTATLDLYQGIQPWLSTIMADQVTKDANGNITSITPTCGKNGLTISQCNQLCAAYPNLCLADEIQKAQLPQYRYATESFQVENFDANEEVGGVPLYVFIIIIVFAFCIAIWIRCRCKYGKQISTTKPIGQQSPSINSV